MTQSQLDPQFWRRLRLFIFDLDGTLIDSRLDLANSVNATLQEFGFQARPQEEIFRYVGRGASMLIRRSLGHPEDDQLVQRALAFFLRYYREHMLDHTVTYPGVREGLAQLAGNGRVLTVLTNKPERFTRAILEGLGLGSYFRLVCGADSFERKKPHPQGVEAILAQTEIAKTEALVVGDSDVDVLTARNAGLPVCAVTYGLGRHGLREQPPDLLVDSLLELAGLVASAARRT
ncbi:MAG: HAD-IA family hydrolase [Candidatus Acidoferrales bacterium]